MESMTSDHDIELKKVTVSRKSPTQERRLQERNTTLQSHNSDITAIKHNVFKPVTGNNTKKNVAWKICHTKPSTKQPTTRYFPKLCIAEQTGNGQILEMIMMEAFMNMNQAIRSRIFANAHSQSTKWQQSKWYHVKGPLFSALNLFHAWLKAGKCPLWCKQNCVNLGSMHSLLEYCQAQLSSIKTEFPHLRLPNTIEAMRFNPDPDKTEKAIYDMLLQEHGSNLYVYSGVSKIGYFTVKDNKWLSSYKCFGFNCLGQIPEYVVPIRKTNGFVVGTVWIDSEDAALRVANEHFHCSLGEIRSRALLKTHTIDNIGHETKTRVFCELKKLISTHGVFFTSSRYESGLSIHTSSDHIADIVRNIAVNMIKEIQAEFGNLEVEVRRHNSKNDVNMTVRNGLICDSVSKDIRRPLFKTNCENIDLVELSKRAEKTGIFSAHSDDKAENYFVSCANSTQAEQYMKDNDFQAVHKPLELKSLANGKHDDIALIQPTRATIQIRYRRSHQTIEQTMSALSALLYKFLGPCHVSQVNATFQECRIKEELIYVIIETTRLCQRSFELFHFLSSNSINGKTIAFTDKSELEKQLCNLEVILPAQIFNLSNFNLKYCIAMLDSGKPDDWFRSTNRLSGETHIFIKTSTRAVMQQVLQTIKIYAKPEHVFPKHIQEYLESPSGQVFLKHVMKVTDTFISYDKRHSCVSIYGVPHQRACAQSVLEESEPAKWRIETIGNVDGVSMQAFLTQIVPRYDSQTKTLMGIDTVSEISLNGSQIFYKTSESCTKSLAEMLVGLKQSMTQDSHNVHCVSGPYSQMETINLSEYECASCLVVVPESYLYTLEGCGHRYCTSCIELQAKTSIQNIVFPMLCAGCNLPFTLFDISNILTLIPNHDAELLLKRSASKQIRQHPELFLECPTSYCDGITFLENASKQIGKPSNKDASSSSKETEGTDVDSISQISLQCCKCKAAICLDCKSLTHTGISCADNQEMYHKWRIGDPYNRKMCPNCKIGIEKRGGCSNVTCATCKNFICWECLQFFSVEDECYKHLRKEHGGYH